jgi:hypothetical protein
LRRARANYRARYPPRHQEEKKPRRKRRRLGLYDMYIYDTGVRISADLNPQSPGLASPVWTFEIRKR